MTDLTGKFAALEAQIAANQAELLDAISLIGEKQDTTTTAINVSTSTLEKAINRISLIASANSPCTDCDGQSIVVPPVSGTPIPIDSDKCQRTQAFLVTMAQFFTVLDTASAFSVPFNPSLITSAISQVISGLSSGDAVPAISFPEAAQLVGDLISYVATNLFTGSTLSDSFSSVRSGLQSAIFAADSTSSDRSAYAEYIQESSLDSWIKPVLIDAAYADIFNFYFDDDSTPNLSGIDGSVCSFPIGTCFELTSEIVTIPAIPNSSWATVGTFGPFEAFDTVNSSSGEISYDKATFYAGDLGGWTWEVLAGHCIIQYRAGGIASSGGFSFTLDRNAPAPAIDCPSGTGCFHIAGDAEFTVRLCFVGV
jgi:hypothetical protein